MSPEDNRYMQRCSELAERAREEGNVAVGSVIVLEDAVLAEAEESVPTGPDPFAHAEFVAVRSALQRVGSEPLREAVLYTTNEPCLMCSFAIREAGIGRVVIEEPTREIGGISSEYPILVADTISRWGPPPEINWTSRPSQQKNETDET